MTTHSLDFESSSASSSRSSSSRDIIVYSNDNKKPQQPVGENRDRRSSCDDYRRISGRTNGVARRCTRVDNRYPHRPRAYSMVSKKNKNDETRAVQYDRNRRQSLPALDNNKNKKLISNFLSVPNSDGSLSDSSEMLSIGDNEDTLRRARSLRERGDKKGDNLRRVRSFKTTSKGLVNRGDSFKRNKNISQPGSANNYGANVQEKLEAIKIVTPDSHDDQAPNHFRVLLLGGPGVGKTSVIDQFMTSEFLGFGDFNISQSEDERTITLQVDGDESTMEFLQSEDLDEATLESFSIDGYIVTYSITDRSSFTLMLELLQQLKDEVGLNKAIIVAANKSDLVRKRTISTEEGRKVADEHGCKYIEISAALNHKVDELLVGTLKQILLKVKAVASDEQGEFLTAAGCKKRKSSFKKTKQFLEKLFRVNSGKEKKTENLYVD